MVSLNTFNPLKWFSSSSDVDWEEVSRKAEQYYETKGQTIVQQLFGAFNTPKFTGHSFLKHFKEGWSKNALVFSAIDYYKKSIGQSSLVVKDMDDDEKIATKHPFTMLTSDPNQFMDERQFLDAIIDHYWLSGNFYAPLAKSRGEEIAEIIPVMPHHMGIIPDEFDWVAGYEHNIGSVEPQKFNKSDVLHIKYQNPTEFDIGISPLASTFRNVDTDNEMTSHVKTLLENRTIPGIILHLAEEFVENEDKRDAIVERYKKKFGGNRKGEPGLMGREDSITELGMDMDELAFPDLSSIEETRILAVFGVSPILLSTSAGLDRSVFKNRRQARVEFWLDNAFDLQDRIAKAMTNQVLFQMEGEQTSLRVGWDNSEVPAVQHVTRSRKNDALKEWKQGVITLNEYRTRFDLDPVDGERGEKFRWELNTMGMEGEEEEGGEIIDMGANQNGDSLPDEEDEDVPEGQKGLVTRS